jgi:hypothetical protein
MSGVQGVQGPQGQQGSPGGTGPTGPQGNAGPQGEPFGPTGAGFYNASTRLILSNFTTGGTITFSNGSASTYFNITSTTPVTILSNASSGSTAAGMFWVFRNNTSNLITISTLTGIANVTYAGSTNATTLYIGSGNSLTLVAEGASSFVAF